jgi:GWxTD domain-containing protein
MRLYLLFISVFLMVASLWGCHSVSNLTVRNYTDLYKETSNDGGIEAIPFVLNDSTVHIYFRVPYHEFVYKTKGQGKISQALFKLHFEVYLNYESPVVIDSGTFAFSDSLHAGSGQMFNFEFDVRAVKGQNYLLSLMLDDINKKHTQNTAIYINRKTRGSSSFFKASQPGAGLLYSPVLENKKDVVITAFDTTLKRLWVNVYRRKFPLPSPPFTPESRAPFDYKPDSSFYLQLKNGVSSPVALSKPGFYYFRSDTVIREGFTLFSFSEGFPELVSSRQLIAALRYITSAKEFDEMSRRPDTRSAVDSFWLATGGNTDRALTLIRDYYSRVQRANELFSSFTEGWQTDRGLIYIVIGPPNVVYRSNLKEEWVYGEAGNMRSMYFYFMKIDNPFTGKDYVLLRDPTIKQAWYMAVERWRR